MKHYPTTKAMGHMTNATDRLPRQASGDARHGVIVRTLWDIGRSPGDYWLGTACHRAGLGSNRRPTQGLATPACTSSERVAMA